MPNATLESAISLVPPRRLGVLLSQSRSASGLTLEEVAERSHGAFSLAELASMERGSRDITDAQLNKLVALYGIDSSHLIPERSRLIVDLEEGLLRVDTNRAKVGSHSDKSDVLGRYLALVYSMRHTKPGTQIPLRVDDLDTLGRALRLTTRTVEADLLALMENPHDIVGRRARLFNRRLLIPAAGVLVAFCGAGALVLTSGSSTPSSGPSTDSVASAAIGATAKVDIGTAVVQERDAQGTAGAVSERSAQVGATSIDTSIGLIPPATLER